MSLMSLIRWIGVLVIGWTFVAIGIGASGTRLPGRDTTGFPPSESPRIEAMPKRWPGREGFDLVDRTSGRKTPIRLPAGDRWSDVTISPWRGRGGEIEAVGRWVNPDREDFSGWAVFRLSDGAVLSRIATEIIPTGRPCWVPGQSRMILFAAGDGQLYRCRLTPEEEMTAIPRPHLYASGRTEPSDLVAWEDSPPGEGDPMMTDPVWPTDPRLKKWVFVALMTLDKSGRWLSYGPPQIWWLELSEEARSIVAAGRLTPPTEGEIEPHRIEQRFPNIAVGPDGTIHLVYLERRNRERTGRLRSAMIEFDARTGHPRAVPTAERSDPGTPEAIAPAPLLVSSDGATVYGYSLSGPLAALPAVVREEPTGPPPTRHDRVSRP